MAYITGFTQEMVGTTVYMANEPHNGGTDQIYIAKVESKDLAFQWWQGRLVKVYRENNSFYTEKEEADDESERMGYNFKRSYDSWATSRL